MDTDRGRREALYFWCYIPRAGVTWARMAYIGMGSRQGWVGHQDRGVYWDFVLFLGRCITVVVSRSFKVYVGLLMVHKMPGSLGQQLANFAV
jgi:hypothetical protein